MEFFRTITVKTDEKTIQDRLTINSLDLISEDIFVIGTQNKLQAEIGGVWGEFTLTRSEIRGGVRFALVECPNALTWTITTGFKPNPDVIVLHLTINRQTHGADFITEIKAFLDGQSKLLQAFTAQ